MSTLHRYLWLLVLPIACEGAIGGDAEVAAGATQLPDGVCAVSDNDEVRLLLEPTCAGCHGANANKPFFASLSAFESLLVYNPDYVTPGNPDGSLLIQLLEGKAPGLFRQMPPTGESFSARADKGETAISMAKIRDWIATLTPKELDPDPDLSTVSTRRLTAEEVVQTLLDQIGLSIEEDFFDQYASNYVSPTVVLKGQLQVYSPDAAPPSHYGGDHSQRFIALGGPGWMERRPRNQSISPPFLQTLVQVSQAWCQMAVQKPGNTALFGKAPKDSTVESEVRANIGYLYLRMLGEQPTEEDIGRIYTEVFQNYQPAGNDVAWTAVCASFVRHPLWLSF
jgi:hypothetical protein